MMESFQCKSCGSISKITNHRKKLSRSDMLKDRLKNFDYKHLDELEKLLVDFTVDVLSKKPSQLYQYANEYFSNFRFQSTKDEKQETTREIDEDFNYYVEEKEDEKDNINNYNIDNNNPNLSDSMSNQIENTEVKMESIAPFENDENILIKHDHEIKIYYDNKDNNNSNDDEENENEDYDEFEVTHLNSRKNIYQSQSRRISVFSKSFDPESNTQVQFTRHELNNIDESDELRGDKTNNNNNNNSGSYEDEYDDYDSEIDQEEYDENSPLAKKRDNYCYESVQNQPYENSSKLKIKNKDDIFKLKQVLKSIVLFKHLYEEDIDLIIDSMFERKTSCDEVIIREGAPGNYFYVILNGYFEVYIKTKKSTVNNKNLNQENKNEDPENEIKHHVEYGTRISEYVNKGYFGELALLYNQPRSATIMCKEEGSTLFCMNRDIFQRLVITSAFKRRKMYEEFLASVPLLKESMNDYERSEVASCLTTKTYMPGEIIFKQNDQANGIYFIESGWVQVFQEDEETDGFRDLGKLGCGQYFGEVALINKSPRSATVVAFLDESNKNTKPNNNIEYACKLAFMDIDAFERLMGPCLDLLKNKIMSYKA